MEHFKQKNRNCCYYPNIALANYVFYIVTVFTVQTVSLLPQNEKIHVIDIIINKTEKIIYIQHRHKITL